MLRLARISFILLVCALPRPTSATFYQGVELEGHEHGPFDGFWSAFPSAMLPDTHLMSKVSWHDRIANEAQHLTQLEFVPYVWGGGKLGKPDVCSRCRACLKHKNPPDRQGLSGCPMCRRCGLDCSHFVHELYQRVGLPVPYLSTDVMARLSDAALAKSYQLIHMGKDPAIVEVGDLLLFPRHVVVVVARRGNGRVDVAESRLARINRSGMMITSEIDPSFYRGALRKILRHQRLFGLPAALPSVDGFLLGKLKPATT